MYRLLNVVCYVSSALFRVVASAHKSDQDICCLVLNLIAKLVPYLSSAGCAAPKNAESSSSSAVVSDSRRESRQITLSLVAIYWKFVHVGSYGRDTRQAVAACMTACVKVGAIRSRS